MEFLTSMKKDTNKFKLSDEQTRAVECDDTRILCLAGAGAGKTVCIIERIKRLIRDGATPDSFLVLTFTNAAAAEMRQRFDSDDDDLHTPTFCTFHAFCYSLLSKDSAIRQHLKYSRIPEIIQKNKLDVVERKIKLEYGIKLSSQQLHDKTRLSSLDEYRQYDIFQKIRRDTLIKQNLITFDMMLSMISNLFVTYDPLTDRYKRQYKYILVDEFQDTDPLQWEFVQSFVNSSIFVVGDALQNLYSFRGTDNEIIKGLSKSSDWTVVKLHNNYRSSSAICDYANNMSDYADDDYRIELHSDKPGCAVKECDMIEPEDVLDAMKGLYATQIAILCRTNREVSEVQNCLKEHGYSVSTTVNDYPEKIIKCAANNQHWKNQILSDLSEDEYLKYLKYRYDSPGPMTARQLRDKFYSNPRVRQDYQVVREFREIVYSKDLSDARKYHKLCSLLGVVACASNELDALNLSPVRRIIYTLSNPSENFKSAYVGTIHSVKGLEFESVILYGVGSRYFQLKSEDNLNCFYVGITRAKDNLVVMWEEQ